MLDEVKESEIKEKKEKKLSLMEELLEKQKHKRLSTKEILLLRREKKIFETKQTEILIKKLDKAIETKVITNIGSGILELMKKYEEITDEEKIFLSMGIIASKLEESYTNKDMLIEKGKGLFRINNLNKLVIIKIEEKENE